jgi:DNA topoisomerase-1
MSKNLMIVESPAKAKIIEKFLGQDFTVRSCYGHVRDLPKGDTAIDVNNNYKPQYEISEDKKQVVADLRKLAKSVEQVWLATDEDREGEAISWHLCEVLNLNIKNAKRIVFHEITKPAIQKAVQNPRLIDTHLVDAQQARRVVDRLVGFEISPILWRKISGTSLSAGRVQSVAARLVVEREREIATFESTPYFKIIATFKVKDKDGKEVYFKGELPEKIDTQNDAKTFLQNCIGANFTIIDLQVKPAKKSPPPPFITSTLQQEANRKLGFSVSRTMNIAQKLYEAGKITYMRTDSTYLSDTAITNASQEIVNSYGDKYLQNRQFKTKSALAQEAHEAIRPTYFEQHEAGETPEERKLYSLIWKRTLASQMSDAQLERTTATIDISTLPKDKLVARGEVLKFDGFLTLYRESAIDEESEEEQSSMLPPLSVGQVLALRDMQATEKFPRAAARYNEASLVKRLEELGIGRPSTYAATISTIQNRGYVVREDREGTMRDFRVLLLTGPNGNPPNNISAKTSQERTGVEKAKLFPTDIGMVVNDFLVKHFSNIVDYNFTAQIEKQFDEVAQGNSQWTDVVDNFYKPFHITVEDTKQNAERETGQRLLGKHPKTGKEMFARLGKFGAMVQIGNSDDEEKPLFASIRAPQTLQSITLEQALTLFDLPRNLGEFEGKDMKVSEGRFGPYVQHNSAFYSLPKGADPYTINPEQAVEVILAKRKADIEKVIKSFPEDANIQVLNGRFGPYIKAGAANIKIPKGTDPKELTFEDCKALIGNTPMTKQVKINEKDILKKFVEDTTVFVLKGRFGPYIKAGEANVKIPKDTNAEALTYDDCRKLIDKPESTKKAKTSDTATTKTKTATTKAKKTK